MQPAISNFAFDKVVLAIKQVTPVEAASISRPTRLVEDLRFGGFSRLKLAIYLEEIFGVELPDEVLKRFITVADIVNYLSRR